MVKTLVGIAAVGAVGLVGLPVVMAGLVLSASTSGGNDNGSTGRGGLVTACSIAGVTPASAGDLDATQVDNARRIIAVGKQLHVPTRGWVIAIATALQESGLRALGYGDRDSLGLFQQRPSAGWGTPTQVQNPTYAARAFYGGPHSPTGNSGLLSVPHWRTRPLWQAAQAVQRSAFPLAYATHEATATGIVRRLAGVTAGCARLQQGPWRLPVTGGYTLTSDYGTRTSPTRGGADFHTGQDFAIARGTPIHAVSSGRVLSAGPTGSGYGTLVRLRHAHGVQSWYAHMSATTVDPGDRVRAGQVIGRVGSTGNSTGPHVHLEIRVHDQPRDPMPWLRAKGLHP